MTHRKIMPTPPARISGETRARWRDEGLKGLPGTRHDWRREGNSRGRKKSLLELSFKSGRLGVILQETLERPALTADTGRQEEDRLGKRYTDTGLQSRLRVVQLNFLHLAATTGITNVFQRHDTLPWIKKYFKTSHWNITLTCTNYRTLTDATEFDTPMHVVTICQHQGKTAWLTGRLDKIVTNSGFVYLISSCAQVRPKRRAKGRFTRQDREWNAIARLLGPKSGCNSPGDFSQTTLHWEIRAKAGSTVLWSRLPFVRESACSLCGHTVRGYHMNVCLS